MKQANAYLVGAGAFSTAGFHPGPQDLVIAADGGYAALKRLGIRPDLVVGDMDSIRRLPSGIPILRFPARKDDTDLALCLKLALGRGYRRFKLYGALGGRMDHSLANLQLLAGLSKLGMDGTIIAKGLQVRAVTDGHLALAPREKGQVLSVFAWGGDARGVSLSGVLYPLWGASLSAFQPLGVSNEFLGKPVSISVKAGTLLAFVYRP